jgi:hypothetical protein
MGMMNGNRKKQRSISELIGGKKEKVKSSAKNKNPEAKVTTRNILMGWLHNGVRVGLEKGGGTRERRAPVTICHEELVEAGKNCFFITAKVHSEIYKIWCLVLQISSTNN